MQDYHLLGKPAYLMLNALFNSLLCRHIIGMATIQFFIEIRTENNGVDHILPRFQSDEKSIFIRRP